MFDEDGFKRNKESGAIIQDVFLNLVLCHIFLLARGCIKPICRSDVLKSIWSYHYKQFNDADLELVDIQDGRGKPRWNHHADWGRDKGVRLHLIEPVEKVGWGYWQLTESGFKEAQGIIPKYIAFLTKTNEEVRGIVVDLLEKSKLPISYEDENYKDPLERLDEVYDQLSIFEQLVLFLSIWGENSFSFDELDFHIGVHGHQVENWHETVREMIPALESTGLFKIKENEDPELEMWTLTDKGIELADILARIYKIEF